MAIDNVGGGGRSEEPSAGDLRSAMLEAAGYPADAEWSGETADEVMKALGREKLRALMRDHGRLDPDVINAELTVIEERLGKLEKEVCRDEGYVSDCAIFCHRVRNNEKGNDQDTIRYVRDTIHLF